MQQEGQQLDVARLTQLLKGCDPDTLGTFLFQQQYNNQHSQPRFQQCQPEHDERNQQHNTQPFDTVDTVQADRQTGHLATNLDDKCDRHSAAVFRHSQHQHQHQLDSTAHQPATQSHQKTNLLTRMLGQVVKQTSDSTAAAGSANTVATTAVAAVLAAVALSAGDGSSAPDTRQDAKAVQHASQLLPVDGAVTAAAADSSRTSTGASAEAVLEPALHLVQQEQQMYDEQNSTDQQQQLTSLLHVLEQQQSDKHQSTRQAPASKRHRAKHALTDKGSGRASKQQQCCQRAGLPSAAGRKAVAAVAAAAAAAAAEGSPFDVLLEAAAAAAHCGSSSNNTAADVSTSQAYQQSQHSRHLMPWEELELGKQQQQQLHGNQHHADQQQSMQSTMLWRHNDHEHNSDDMIEQQPNGDAENDEQQQQLLLLQQLAAKVQQQQQHFMPDEDLMNDPAYLAALAAPPASAAAVASSAETSSAAAGGSSIAISQTCDYTVWLPQLLQRKGFFEECPRCGDSLIVKYFNVSCPTEAHCFNCCPEYSHVVDATALRSKSGGSVDVALAQATDAAAAAAAGDLQDAAPGGASQPDLQPTTTPREQQPQQQQPQRKQRRGKQQQLDHSHPGPLLLPLYHSALRGSIAAANPHDLLALQINITGVKAFQRNNGTKPFMLLQSQVWGGNSGQRMPGVAAAAAGGPDSTAAYQPQRQSYRRGAERRAKDSTASAAAASAAAAECVGCKLYRLESSSSSAQQQHLYCSLSCKLQQGGLESFKLHPEANTALSWEQISSKPLSGGGVRLGRKRKMEGIEAAAAAAAAAAGILLPAKKKGGKGSKAAAAAAAGPWDGQAAAAAPAAGVLHQWGSMAQQQLPAKGGNSRKKTKAQGITAAAAGAAGEIEAASS